MAGILQDRIIESVFVAVDVLRPVFGVLTAVNPAVVVLGLDDEDAINRHDQVIYLRTAFGCWYRHIVQHPVLVLRQVILFSAQLLSLRPYPSMESATGAGRTARECMPIRIILLVNPLFLIRLVWRIFFSIPHSPKFIKVTGGNNSRREGNNSDSEQ